MPSLQLSGSGGGKTVILKLYRDCLRLIQHVAPGSSPKSLALRATVRSEFRRHAGLTDADAIETAKANAVRALSNYLLATAAPNDAKLETAANEYHSRSVKEANVWQKQNKNGTVDETSKQRADRK